MQELNKEKVEYALALLMRIFEARKMTETQLAERSGVHQSTISKILSRSFDNHEEPYTPSEDILRKLFKGLGFKLEHIIDESYAIADEIVGYLATPLTGLSSIADQGVRTVVNTIKTVASESQYSTPPFEIYWPGDHTHPLLHDDISASQVYVTDRSRAASYDFIILFCGSPSYGVGQENEIATQAGIPAIRLLPPVASRMMTGSFINAIDISYSGTLERGVTFDLDELRRALTAMRRVYFRHRAFYRGMNGNAFGARLRKLIDGRCGDYAHFADDLGISLRYLHNLMEEPFAVSNPSVRLLKRMALRLGESVAYLIGDSEESDPIFVESEASWLSWAETTQGTETSIALQMREEWRHEYARNRREQAGCASFRKSAPLMREADWDKRYRRLMKTRGGDGANDKQRSLL